MKPSARVVLPCVALLLLVLFTSCDQPAVPQSSSSQKGAAPAPSLTLTSPQTGTRDGYYYSFWTNGVGAVSMTLGSAGSYSVDWNNNVAGSFGDFTGGVGWNPGDSRSVTYSGSYVNSGGGACGVYGWTTNPLVEYYIVDSNGAGGGPGQGTPMGTVISDGDIYDIYKHQQVNQPSILGNSSTFEQYISVRRSPRTSGTITVANHFDAWKNLGMQLGTMNYEILLTEGWNGSGSSSITVSK